MDSQPTPLDDDDLPGPLRRSGSQPAQGPHGSHGSHGDPVPSAASAGAADLDEPADRRSSPRRQMPLGPAFRADLVILGRPLSLSLEDVSQGGVALRASKAEASGLLVGRRLPQVRLTLGEYGMLMVGLEVRARRSFRSFLAGEQVYVGCQFIDLPPAVAERLKVVIQQLQASP